MMVVDASVALEVLLQTAAGSRIAERVLDPKETLHAPHLLDLEVAQTLRRYVHRGDLTTGRSEQALADLLDLPIERHPHYLFLDRIWQLRNNVTVYDAAYIALAEALDAPVVTRDAAFAAFRGHRVKVELV